MEFILLDPLFTAWSKGDLLAAIAAFLSGAAIVPALLGALRGWLDKRRLIADFGGDFYQEEDIENWTRYYVRPDASGIDLAQEDNDAAVAPRENLFDAVDRFLAHKSAHRHLLLLADSGMGKSAFVLNYYHYNQRKARRRLAVIPLGHEKALEKIQQIEKPKETVLFLDAFDEDPKARHGYEERFDELLSACSEFRRVLITCRTQFFPKDDAIRTEARMVFAPRDGRARLTFWRLYLAPFNDKQIDRFLRRRFWFWSFKKRRKARALVKKVPNLTVRPMLLKHIPDFLTAEKPVSTTWDIYETLTEKWYTREEGFWSDRKHLADFSEEVAVQLYLTFLSSGADRVSREDIGIILNDLQESRDRDYWAGRSELRDSIDIDEWKATARSLLHRDAKGNWKFAHRSIMEFLVLKRFFDGDARCRGIAWTDQMKKLALETTIFNGHPLSVNSLSGLDLSGANLRKTNLRDADLRKAKLRLADLREARLRGANLRGADLRDADLRGADLDQADISRADISGAKFEGASLVGTVVSEDHLSNPFIKAAPQLFAHKNFSGYQPVSKYKREGRVLQALRRAKGETESTTDDQKISERIRDSFHE